MFLRFSMSYCHCHSKWLFSSRCILNGDALSGILSHSLTLQGFWFSFLSFVWIVKSAGRSSHPLPLCPPLSNPSSFKYFVVASPLFLIHLLFSPSHHCHVWFFSSYPAAVFFLTSFFFPPLTSPVSLTSGRQRLHRVSRAHRQQRAGWPQPGNSSAAEVSACTLETQVNIFVSLPLI